jgi:histidinol dehydrogenase
MSAAEWFTWRRLRPEDVRGCAGEALDAATLAIAKTIVDDVESGGMAAARAHGERLGDLQPGDPLWLDRAALATAFDGLPLAQQQLLQRVSRRIATFANAQKASLREFDLPLPGGVASQRIAPVASAGCYAPGGRAVLPSSLLMTAVTAKVAGVPRVTAASPRPASIVMGAAHVAGCDGLLALGGAQAIAALTFGLDELLPHDVVVGPGNRFVTAAKQLVQGRVGVDLPAGPSELCVLADGSAEPELIAADLLAQAEHDPSARPWLVCTEAGVIDAVERALGRQLAELPTATIARAALAGGGAVLCADLATALVVCDRLAPEHLQLAVGDAAALVPRLQHYGALFCGRHGAEVLGDYGAGPNHVLPTGGAARYSGGLSVFRFLRVRTILQLESSDPELLADAAALAELEGLPGHAASARLRTRLESS